MMKKLCAVLMIVVLLLSLSVGSVAATADGPDDWFPEMWEASEWAKPELLEAYHLHLMTEKVMGNYTSNITRAEFAGLAVRLFEALTDTTATAASRNTFNDTSDVDVLKAYNLGIVSGVGGGAFAPNNLITREQMAVMYYNTIQAVVYHYGDTMPYSSGILYVNDASNVSDWARDQVIFVIDYGIMSGDGVRFNPKGNASREAAIAVVKRVYNEYKYYKYHYGYEENYYFDDYYYGYETEEVVITNPTSIRIYKPDDRRYRRANLEVYFVHEDIGYKTSASIGDIEGQITIDLRLNNEGIYNANHYTYIGDYLDVTKTSSDRTKIRINNYIGEMRDIHLIFNLELERAEGFLGAAAPRINVVSHTEINDFTTDHIFNLDLRSISHNAAENVSGDYLEPTF